MHVRLPERESLRTRIKMLKTSGGDRGAGCAGRQTIVTPQKGDSTALTIKGKGEDGEEKRSTG